MIISLIKKRKIANYSLFSVPLLHQYVYESNGLAIVFSKKIGEKASL